MKSALTPLTALAGLAAFCLLAQPALAGPAGHVWHVSPATLPAVAAASQFRTIGEAAKRVGPGDVVLIHTGVYRESVSVSTSGTPARPIRFEAAPAANVVVTGADRVTGWQKEPGPDNVYSVAWPYSFLNNSPIHAHPDDDYHRLIGRTEQVIVQNYQLHQVLHRAEMSRGSFFADLEAKRLYVWDLANQDLSGVSVEASVRDVLWNCMGAYVGVRGIRFRYAANAAQQGAGRFTGKGDVVRDCTFERTNGNGASFSAPDLVVDGCTFRDNGQLGFGAALADRLHLSGCLIQNNNVKDFDRGWEAGGEKVVLSRGVVIDHCRALDNRGSGLWFDIGNEDCEVKNCLVAGNEDAGIFYEISYGLHAHDNVIVGNGLGDDSGGSWGAEAGICLSSSPNCVIERNLLVANKEGFDFREQGRTTPRLGSPPGSKEVAVWNHDETIRNNVLAANRDAQTWGWFDVLDERPWPRAMQTKKDGPTPGVTQAPQNFAQDYVAKDKNGQPLGLTLETLRLHFSGNLYDTPDGQDLFHWGTFWRRHTYYTSLADVRRDLALEQGSASAPFRFGDYLTRDFRVPAGSPALRMGCYPAGTVPDVQLGLLPGEAPTKKVADRTVIGHIP